MGGFGSGRSGGRPTVEDGLTIDICMMLRRGWVKAGRAGTGSQTWSCRGERIASVSHRYDLSDPDQAEMTLFYTRTPRDGPPEKVEQQIRLVYTNPNYGGRRWWMLCPFSGRRVGKLHLPPAGNRFASRLKWRLAYQSQRSARSFRPFDKLFRLQRKLGSPEGYDNWLRRPKGMWKRTFERHLERYMQLDEPCSAMMLSFEERLKS